MDYFRNRFYLIRGWGWAYARLGWVRINIERDCESHPSRPFCIGIWVERVVSPPWDGEV